MIGSIGKPIGDRTLSCLAFPEALIFHQKRFISYYGHLRLQQFRKRPGEVVKVIVDEEGEIVIKRFTRVKDPLKVLVGVTAFPRHVTIEELEEKVETR